MEGVFRLSRTLEKTGECLVGFDAEDGVWELRFRERRCHR